jgi:hypothetical protein
MSARSALGSTVKEFGLPNSTKASDPSLTTSNAVRASDVKSFEESSSKVTVTLSETEVAILKGAKVAPSPLFAILSLEVTTLTLTAPGISSITTPLPSAIDTPHTDHDASIAG